MLLCSFKAQGQKIMFHIYAMGNIVGGVEFVITYGPFLWQCVCVCVCVFFWSFFVLAKFLHDNLCWSLNCHINTFKVYMSNYMVGQYVGFSTNKRNKMVNFDLLLRVILSEICRYI
jgi:hypothetical protein